MGILESMDFFASYLLLFVGEGHILITRKLGFGLQTFRKDCTYNDWIYAWVISLKITMTSFLLKLKNLYFLLKLKTKSPKIYNYFQKCFIFL